MSIMDSQLSDSDVEIQNALASGTIKPGLTVVTKPPKKFVNNKVGLQQKLEEFNQLEWMERLDNISQPAPLAPELASRLFTEEQKRENQKKNNKKLPQYKPEDDPVLNDFKRETMFYRQAQSTVMEAIPKLKALGIATIRPDDYFAEMAKTDLQMQKIRNALKKKETQQKQSERVKQVRIQRKEGKRIQAQMKLEKQKEKKEILEEVKKVRKGVRKDLDFLNKKKPFKKLKREQKDKKFGFGGKKRGMKSNEKKSSHDISEYRGKPSKIKRPGKSRRNQSKRRN